MTWNLLGAANPDLAAISRVLEDAEPDVVALQEVRASQARRLAEARGWAHRWNRKHYPWTPLLWWRAEGLAILSPHVVSQPDVLVLTPRASSWTYRRRIAQRADVARPRDAAVLSVTNVHLSTGVAARRAREVHLLLELIQGGRTDVIAGDLNEDHQGPAASIFTASGFRATTGAPTSPADRPLRRLDHVLVRTDAQVADVWTPEGGPAWRALSDHLPVVVTVASTP